MKALWLEDVSKLVPMQEKINQLKSRQVEEPMNEPQGLGAVVRARLKVTEKPRLFIRTFDGFWLTARNDEWSWDRLLDPEVLHEGHIPSTLEPTGLLAVVRDADGLKFVGVKDSIGMRWMEDDGASAKQWASMKQPVDVLFEGLE